MSSSLRRFTAPSLAVLALAAVPLVAPVAANAALGGAFPATTTLKPDLRSATVLTAPNAGASSIVRVCFDKPLDSAAPTAPNFKLGAYDHTPPPTTSSVTKTSANCVDATFGKGSLVPYTYVTVAAGGVQTTGVRNLDDSTALINATPSNNGTTGKTTGPDLTGIQRVSNTQARFIFDENVVSPAATNFAKFHLDAASGTPSDATSAAVDAGAPNVVVANFVNGVDAAVRGYADAGAVNSDAANDPNPLLAVALPAPGGTLSTAKPDLISATVAADGTTVDFKFDENISGSVLNAADFTVVRSDGTSPGPLVPTVLPDNVTVRATIPSGSSQNEYFVVASASAGAVTSTTGGRMSTAGGVPVGANQGAAATGFTTGPEVLSATFNATGGTVALKLDQRFFTFDQTKITLLDASGNTVGTAAAVTGAASSTPAQVTATAVFTPTQVAAAKSVQVDADAFKTFLGAGVGGNVVQIVSPTAP